MTEHTPPIEEDDTPATKAVIDNQSNENTEMTQQPQDYVTVTTVITNSQNDQDVNENTPTTTQEDNPTLFTMHSETSNSSEHSHQEDLTVKANCDNEAPEGVHNPSNNSNSGEMVMNFDSDIESETQETISENDITPIYAQIMKKKVTLNVY